MCSEDSDTYDQVRECDTKHESVEGHGEPPVLSLDDPRRKGDPLAHLLLAVRVTEQLVVASDLFVCQGFVCLCELAECRVDVVHGLVDGQLDLVRMKLERHFAVVTLDVLLRQALPFVTRVSGSAKAQIVK